MTSSGSRHETAGSIYDRPVETRLPSMGPRGEGWVIIQAVLLFAIAVSAIAGPAWSGGLRVLSLVVGGTAIVAGGTLVIGGMRGLGGQVTPFPRPSADASLVETGAYSLVRHPIYGGLILGALGWGLVAASIPTLGLTVVLLGFFDLKSRREEAWLVARFPGYAAYRGRTKRLIPYLY